MRRGKENALIFEQDEVLLINKFLQDGCTIGFIGKRFGLSKQAMNDHLKKFGSYRQFDLEKALQYYKQLNEENNDK